MTIKLRINQKHDPDLHALACRIGSRKFCKLTRISLGAVFDAALKHEARELVKNAPVVNENLPPVLILSFSFTKSSDMAIVAAIAMVQSGAVGSFTKSAIRFAIGPELVMGLYLSDAEGLPPLSQDAPVVIVGSSMQKSSRRTPRRKPVAPRPAYTKKIVQIENPAPVIEAPVQSPMPAVAKTPAPVYEPISIPSEPVVENDAAVSEDDFLAMIEDLL